MRYTQAARLVGALLVLSALASGCQPAVGEVKGRVLYKGQVVPSGSVIFVGEGGKQYNCSIAEGDNTYTMRDVPPGKVRIAVWSHPRVPPGLSNPPKIKPAPGTPPTKKGEKTEPRVNIPPRYQSVETSGLILEVRAGTQSHDIPLAPP
jgi:hypothetical protein